MKDLDQSTANFIATLRDARIVPVIRHEDPAIALAACELLAEAGVRALEITTTVPDSPALIARLRRRFPGLCIGAGTVLTAAQAGDVLAAGVNFVVSPCWSAAAAPVIEAGVPWLPGAMTPGEVLHHSQNGAAVVKLFPAAAVGGPDFAKALKSVFPHTELMPTGGITPQTTQAWLDAGCLCVGMGGRLVPVHALEAGDAGLARRQIAEALTAIPRPAQTGNTAR